MFSSNGRTCNQIWFLTKKLRAISFFKYKLIVLLSDKVTRCTSRFKGNSVF